jgi:hypothetical protein
MLLQLLSVNVRTNTVDFLAILAIGQGNTKGFGSGAFGSPDAGDHACNHAARVKPTLQKPLIENFSYTIKKFNPYTKVSWAT